MNYEQLGSLTVLAQTPPENVDPIAWRLGYANALSDLIAMIWPDAPGRQRLSLDELKADDARRGFGND